MSLLSLFLLAIRMGFFGGGIVRPTNDVLFRITRHAEYFVVVPHELRVATSAGYRVRIVTMGRTSTRPTGEASRLRRAQSRILRNKNSTV